MCIDLSRDCLLFFYLAIRAFPARAMDFACPKPLNQKGKQGTPLLIPCRRTRHAVPMVRTVTQTGGSISTILFI